MNDPWKYARVLRAKNTLELTEEMAMLLADADALLAVVRMARRLVDSDEGFGPEYHMLIDALAALPEHLK